MEYTAMIVRLVITCLNLGLFLAAGAYAQQPNSAEASNQPPRVSIVWPRAGNTWDHTFNLGTFVRLKAEASDPDGFVTQVQFYSGTNLLGIVTNAPFNLLWSVYGSFDGYKLVLTAVAIDDAGAITVSAPVTIFYTITLPPHPVVDILFPRDGELLADPASFTFSAEVLASEGDAGPVEFFVGTNSLGIVPGEHRITANTQPVSVVVTNLPEGIHTLSVNYLGIGGYDCLRCIFPNTIRVTKLGLCRPRVTNEGRVDVEVVTSFPGRPTVIEASWDFRQWLPVSTNEPAGNSFIFSEPFARTNSQRAYRAHLLR